MNMKPPNHESASGAFALCQIAGITKAKKEVKYHGRRPSADKERIKAMLEAGKSHAAIAKELGCSTKTVQRMKQE